MLKKLFKFHKLTTHSRKVSHKQGAGAALSLSGSSSALKIVHAGGFVECYYMAIPAVRILEKYPSCILARPEVFRRQWDSVVRPEEILTLDEKFFLVPPRAVRKLWRRIRKPDKEASSNCFAFKSCIDVSVDKISRESNDFPRKTSCQQIEAKVSAEKTAYEKKTTVQKHVRFVGIAEKDGKLEDDPGSKSLNSVSYEAKRKPRNAASALAAICEKNDRVAFSKANV